MRLSRNRILGTAVLAGAALLCAANVARAQDGQFLMPEQSAAKAKELLNQTITALGGAAYLNVHDYTCTGRSGTFDHSGDMTNFVELKDSRELPDKARFEYTRKGRNSILQYAVGIDEGLEFTHGGIVITVYNGNRGWSYDRNGVTELPADSIHDFRDQVNRSLGSVLRFRLKEPDMNFRYGGEDAVDLKPADWVELTDADDNTIRIAIARDTHLPIREVVQVRDPHARVKVEQIYYFANYHAMNGVMTPLQTSQERNGIRISQTFLDRCDYNLNPPEAAFTRDMLDKRWAQVSDKEKAQDKKEAQRVKDKQKEDQDSDNTPKKN